MRRIICLDVSKSSDPESVNNNCVAKDSGQSARKYKENFSAEIEDEGSLNPFLKSSNTEYRFFANSHCSL
jgi:hypothetical protein